MSRLMAVTVCAVALGLAPGAGCERQPGVVMVEEDDAAMDAAVQQARATVERFIAALESPAAGQGDFSVKAAFPVAEGESEHMWLMNVSYRDGLLHGEVNNDPVSTKAVRLGDQASVAPAEISDWMYVENGRAIGAYTTRVLLSRMSEKERRQIEEGTGLKWD